MLFNSLDFAIFLPCVFLLYWFVFKSDLRQQNLYLVIVSYIFYAWWDWRFLSLIAVSTIVDFFVAKAIQRTSSKKARKQYLILSLVVNFGILGFFKYFNFFIETFVDAFTLFGGDLDTWTLRIVLPVGISFYTFQTLSYTIDVYRKRIKATDKLISFAAFVCFFPQLVAGPIERASHLLPQFEKTRKFDYLKAVDGSRQMLWGFFKKMVIADNCAEYANLIFSNAGDCNGFTLFLGAIFFAFQIYGDFSGYSDIAIGTSRLFGFDLRQNFAFPYFSRNIGEFWRRWHISLSTWFRDYLYIPLGGSKLGRLISIRNIFVIFIISGFWHGANWTFIFWGGLNAVLFIPLLITGKNRSFLDVVAHDRLLPTAKEVWQILTTFLLVTLGWVFFRAESIAQAFEIVQKIFSSSLFSVPEFSGRVGALSTIFLLLFFLAVEWIGRQDLYAIENLMLKRPRFQRWTFYFLIVFLIGMFAKTNETPFIYFQF